MPSRSRRASRGRAVCISRGNKAVSVRGFSAAAACLLDGVYECTAEYT